ncbi:hypothetical protein UR09_05530 [Candidatus Nitromaritima sp. SCGC AAA799-A02]|nr:hypothetical protein UR09_05530 [Candidatus Nitromaritima sp. SCGC AAA799-A02]KMP10950.1 hypothetical protein UZ36_06005 [Candidatus Nitromaritima sp. SCGC AAA799-C22]
MSTERTLRIVLLAAFFLLGLGPLQDESTEKGRDNPFLLPEGVYPQGKGPPVRDEKLTLEAILTTEGQRIATISNMNFIVGDLISGRKVVEILEDRVILEAKGVQSILMLQTRSFPVRVSNSN